MSFFKKIFSSEEKEFPQTEVLLEAQSPLCPITAIVEQDNRVAYFYLVGNEGSNFGMKSCWLRNLKEAPDKIEVKQIKNGMPPMMPKEFCKFPEGQEKLNKKDLSIIWTEEGDSAAILIKNEIAAIIPIWGGQGGFYGYSRDCKGQGNFAWELLDSNVYLERIKSAMGYWESWDNEITPFNTQQPQILETYEETFGKHDKYYAIDGGKWPPKGLYLRKGESKTIYATIGLSLVPMPMVELYTENRFDLHRIELGIILDSVFSEKELQQIAEWISGQSSIPWKSITFLGEGHTINFKPFNSTIFNFVLLTNKLDILPKPELENYKESKINFLWMLPISEKERIEIIDNGSEGIIEKLNKIGKEVFSLKREEVI